MPAKCGSCGAVEPSALWVGEAADVCTRCWVDGTNLETSRALVLARALEARLQLLELARRREEVERWAQEERRRRLAELRAERPRPFRTVLRGGPLRRALCALLLGDRREWTVPELVERVGTDQTNVWTALRPMLEHGLAVRRLLPGRSTYAVQLTELGERHAAEWERKHAEASRYRSTG